jgi:hypothetical protein
VPVRGVQTCWARGPAFKFLMCYPAEVLVVVALVFGGVTFQQVRGSHMPNAELGTRRGATRFPHVHAMQEGTGGGWQCAGSPVSGVQRRMGCLDWPPPEHALCSVCVRGGRLAPLAGASFYLTIVALLLLTWMRIALVRVSLLPMLPIGINPVRGHARTRTLSCLSGDRGNGMQSALPVNPRG